MVDCKQLLEKYMRHVIDCEGWSYTSEMDGRSDRIFFAPEEKEYLLKLYKEIERSLEFEAQFKK